MESQTPPPLIWEAFLNRPDESSILRYNETSDNISRTCQKLPVALWIPQAIPTARSCPVLAHLRSRPLRSKNHISVDATKIKKWKYDWWRCSQSRHTHKCTHCSPQVWHIGCRLQDFQGALSRSCSQTSCCPCRWRLSCIRCCFNWPSPFSVLLFRLAHWHFLGTRGAPKMVEFSEKFQRGCGGGGPFSIKKFILQILDL